MKWRSLSEWCSLPQQCHAVHEHSAHGEGSYPQHELSSVLYDVLSGWCVILIYFIHREIPFCYANAGGKEIFYKQNRNYVAW